jgi:hypothetical protein
MFNFVIWHEFIIVDGNVNKIEKQWGVKSKRS